MASAEPAATASDRLLELVGCLGSEAGFAEVVESLAGGHAATLDGVWGSSCALVAATLAASAPATLAVVCPQIDQVDELIDDLALFTRLKPERFPASESFDRAAHDEVFGQRLHLLKLLEDAGGPKLVVTSIQSLLQPVPSREDLARHTRTAPRRRFDGRRGAWPDGWWKTVFSTLRPWNCPASSPSAAESSTSLRPTGIGRCGWSSSATRSNRSGGSRFPASGVWSRSAAIDVTIIGPAAADRAHLADYLPPQSWFLLLEPMELEQQGRQYLERVEEPTVSAAEKPA